VQVEEYNDYILLTVDMKTKKKYIWVTAQLSRERGAREPERTCVCECGREVSGPQQQTEAEQSKARRAPSKTYLRMKSKGEE